MLKIFKNPDEAVFKEVQSEVKANGGYCPCKIDKTPSTKCPCLDFRKQDTEGECCCGLYIKKEVSEDA